jgi:hypothetical protein
MIMETLSPNPGRGIPASLALAFFLAGLALGCQPASDTPGPGLIPEECSVEDAESSEGAIGTCAPTDLFDSEFDIAEIRALLMQQQRDWNEGDIRSFMEGYVKSDSLRFASGGTVRYGWQAALDRYLETYPDRDAMGQLTFSDLDIDLLADNYALVFGSWALARGGAYDDIGGLFTLLFVRTDDGWRIKFDHTSSRS